MRAPDFTRVNRSALLRLGTAVAMFSLLLLSLAYWWLENVAHEIFGSALFLLLAWHFYTNRFWFANLFRGRYNARRVVVSAFHLLLAINMLVLLVTSMIVSKSLFAFLPFPDSVPLRDLHWFSAYWLMVAVGIHLGVHWSRVMRMTRTALGIAPRQARGVWVLRVATLAGCGLGLWGLPALELWTKLTFNFSLNFWNFNQSVVPFFVYWTAAVVVPATVTHYGITALRTLPRASQTSWQPSPTKSRQTRDAVVRRREIRALTAEDVHHEGS